MPFAVTHTSGPKSLDKNCRSPWGPRYDLDMKVQRRRAYRDSRDDLQDALVKDHKASIVTRTEHANFLYQMINEVQRYQLCANGNRIPDLALELLAEELAEEMADPEVDHYCDCLIKISQHKVYSSDFIVKANEMVAEYHKKRHASGVVSPMSSQSSSQGLSDEGSEVVTAYTFVKRR